MQLCSDGPMAAVLQQSRRNLHTEELLKVGEIAFAEAHFG